MGGKGRVEVAQDHGVADAAQHADEQPGQACARLAHQVVVRLDVLRKTRSQLVVALRLLAHLVHDVVDGNLSHEPPDAVHYRQGHEVVFLDDLHHLVDGCVHVYRDGVFLHHVFHLRHRGRRDHLLQREDALQAFVVVDDVDVVDFVQLLGLHAHFLQTLGHTPVLVHGHHFRAHESARGVLVILQQVYDVASLFDVLDVREDLLLLVLVEAAHQVYGVVRVHVVHELLGDGFRGEQLEELLADVFVHLHQYVVSLSRRR